MKKHFKRILSLTLVVIMLIPMIPATGLTISAKTYSGTCGDNLTWHLDTDTGVLTINGTGDMYDYESKSSYPYSTSPWASEFYLKSVVIGDSVTSIGDYAFYSCNYLKSITIPDSVTSIGDYAFYSCDSLTSVTIGDSVTSIGKRAFYETAYYNYSSNWSDRVLYIGKYLIEAKKSISGVYSIKDGTLVIADYAFSWCDNLLSVTIPNSVTYIGDYAFEYTRVSDMTIPDSVRGIGDYSFYSCKNLWRVTLGDSVRSIGNYAFNCCTDLDSVIIPDAVTSIGDHAFSSCTDLTSVTIGDSVTSIGESVFYNTAYYKNDSNWTDGVLYIGKYLIIANTSISGAYSIEKGTLAIADSAFSGCDDLTNVTIPNSVTSMGDHVFYNCSKLTSITIPNLVTSIGDYAFYNCSKLTSITIPDSVTSIGYKAFFWCTSLKSVSIGDSVTSIGGYAFCNCESLISVTIGDSVRSIGEQAFSICLALKGVYITDIAAWCKIDFDILANPLNYAGNLYLNNKLVKDLVIPDSVTSIGSYAFDGCTSLTSVTIGDSVTGIGSDAFRDCTSLTSATIGNSVKSIDYRVFYNCTSLTKVFIPDSVKSIRSYAFHYSNDGNDQPLDLTIECYLNSYAHTYAVDEGFKYETSCKHRFIKYKFDNNASCTEDGTKTAYCDNGCGETDTIVDRGSALGHRFKNYVSDNNASCTVDGTKSAYCDHGCGETDTIVDKGTAFGHSFTKYTYTSATCVKDAYGLAYCDNGCGKTDTVVDKGTAFGHTFTVYTDKAATCEEDACSVAYCDNGCGATDIVAEEGTALGHTWTEWTTTKEPTETETGIKEKTCTICDKTETEIIGKYVPMPDVVTGSWYAEGVKYCVLKGYFSGTNEGLFKPNDPLTREQFVVVLAMLDGVDLSEYTGITGFVDIPSGKWYSKAVKWAFVNEYANGVGNGNFGLGVQITREQLATFFYNYAKGTDLDVSQSADLSVYTDYAQISGWARAALGWAVDAGLISSTSTIVKIAKPKGVATRAQAARIFMLFDGIRQ